MRRRRQYLAAMAVTAVVAAGVLAGCGNKEDDTAKTKAQTEESAESQKEGSAVSKSAGKDASEENVQAGEEEQQDAGTDNNQRRQIPRQTIQQKRLRKMRSSGSLRQKPWTVRRWTRIYLQRQI